MNAHLIVIILYSGGLVAFGLWIGRRVTRAGDFFVAGRSLGPGLLFATVLAANIGGGSTVGAAGRGYADGLSAWWWVGSFAIGTVVLAFWVGPRIWRIAADRGFYTVGDFLEYRYGPTTRATVAALIWVATLSILAGQLVGLAKVMEIVIGFPQVASCVLGGVVMTTYFAAGGLTGAAWINLLQLVVLLGGVGVAVPLAVAGAGGWGAVATAVPQVSGDFDNFWRGGASGWHYVALLAPAFVVSPGLVQKAYGARDARVVRLGIGLSGLVLLVFAFAPTLLGMIARIEHPGLADPELALPLLLRENVPLLVGAVGLGALFMAEVSSADAILFMLATSLSQDLYRRFVNPDASDARVLLVARAAAVAGGAGGVLLAIWAESVVAALSIFYTLVGITLFVPVVAGLYTGRGGAVEAFSSIGVGLATYLTVRLATDGAGFGPLTPNLVALLAAAAGFFLVMLARSRGPSAARRG